MELHAGNVRRAARRPRTARRASVDATVSPVDRRGVAVREVDLCAGGTPSTSDAAAASSSAFQPTCGTLQVAEPRRRASRVTHWPPKNAEARHIRRLGAALEQPLHADADAEQRPAARHDARGWPSSTPRSSARVASKWPTPGTTTASAPSRSAGAAGTKIRRRSRERLAHRRQIASAVVDRARSQQSLSCSAASWRQLLVLRAGDAQRAGERLEDRLDVMVARPAVQHLHVDVGARADREAFEEVVDELGLQIADARGRSPSDRRRRAAGRRGRSRPRRASRPSASRSSPRG